MFWSFIKGTIRNITAHRSFTAINVFGLAVGMTCALVISLYVLHEKSYDKQHTDYQDIYRVIVKGRVHGIDFDGATSSGALSEAIYEEVDGIKSVTRVVRLGAWLVTQDSIRYNEDKILFVDSNFFQVFDGFEVLAGNVNEMFMQSSTIAVSESIALKYFNTTAVVGEKVRLETGDGYYTITGVFKDIASNSHMQFDMLASLVTYEKSVSRWVNNNVYTYLKTTNNADISRIDTQINQFVNKYVIKELVEVFNNFFSKEDIYAFELQELSSIHLHSNLDVELETNGRAAYVYSFAIVAILILFIACLNFMNLSSANAINRSKEVILRKVAGAERKTLIVQILVESVIFSLVALVVALLLTELILPAFNTYLNLKLDLNLFGNLMSTLGIVVFAILVGIISGSYPAFVISSFEPIKVLQGKLGRGLSNSSVRAVFVVLQFFISVLLIILTIVIYAQVNYMMKKDLGFDSKHVIVIRRSDALKESIGDFKKEILKNPDVLSVTNSNSIPGRAFFNTTFKLLGQESEPTMLLNQIFVGYDFYSAYDLNLVQGRFFKPEIPTDSFACVINESAAKLMELSYPIGTVLEQPTLFKTKVKNYTIVGMVDDFHFQSVDKPVQPLVICVMPGNWEGFINVKLNPKLKNRTIASIEETWKRYTPDYPFVYFNLNEDFNKGYHSQIKLGRLAAIFSGLAIFVACLGLYGLIAFVSNRRVREIGIRKALGASVFGLIFMLTKETIKLLLLASVLAWGAGFFLADFWLDGFYYRIKLSSGYFVLASLIVMFIAVSTVVVQTYKATRIEPGNSLKYE